MQFARVRVDGEERFVEVDADSLHVLSAAPWSGGERTGESVPRAGARFLAPVTPSKVVCIGRNYRAHAEELGTDVPEAPLLFLKAPSAIIAPGETIELPPESERVDHEGELGVVIGARARDVPEAHAREVIFGYVGANDVTARDLQRKDVQFTRAKSFDTFCPCGPVIDTSLSWEAVDVSVLVDGDVRQDGNTRQMVFGVPELIAYISRVMTLLPGDLILTGTPSGVGPLQPGETVEVRVADLPPLSNPVAPRAR